MNIAIAIDGDIAVWLLVNMYKYKRRMLLIVLKAAISIYDAAHTAKTQHHIFKYKREVFSLNLGLNLYFLLHII